MSVPLHVVYLRWAWTQIDQWEMMLHWWQHIWKSSRAWNRDHNYQISLGPEVHSFETDKPVLTLKSVVKTWICMCSYNYCREIKTALSTDVLIDINEGLSCPCVVCQQRTDPFVSKAAWEATVMGWLGSLYRSASRESSKPNTADRTCSNLLRNHIHFRR